MKLRNEQKWLDIINVHHGLAGEAPLILRTWWRRLLGWHIKQSFVKFSDVLIAAASRGVILRINAFRRCRGTSFVVHSSGKTFLVLPYRLRHEAWIKANPFGSRVRPSAVQISRIIIFFVLLRNKLKMFFFVSKRVLQFLHRLWKQSKQAKIFLEASLSCSLRMIKWFPSISQFLMQPRISFKLRNKVD